MSDGWTLFNYALLAWIITGFITFTLAAVRQIPENEKRMAEEAKQKGTSKPYMMISGRFYISPSNCGIIGGLGLLMIPLGVLAFLIGLFIRDVIRDGFSNATSGGNFSALFIALLLAVIMMLLVHKLSRALSARRRKG